MLALSFLDEEDEAGRDAHAACKTAEDIEPAQEPVPEVLQMQPVRNSMMLATTVGGGSSRMTRPVVPAKCTPCPTSATRSLPARKMLT
jgi:hypothetical protein